ncbi:MAG TPA: DUF2203 domain-containing protein [Acidobacteriaceae bacterium]|nr:DUF2203 domain-containing protein [Acidobacteriaceae bacterium]
MNKTFTWSEAQTVLPVVEALLRRAQAAHIRAAQLNREMQELSQRIFFSGGMHVNVAQAARRRAEHDKATRETTGTLAEIDEIGVMVKDLDQGLLDFPAVLEGRTVLLCWKLGEKEIGFWHSMDEGFAGRKPLDVRFGKTTRERLN